MNTLYAIIVTSEKGKIDRGKIPAFTHRELAEEYAKSYQICGHEFEIFEFVHQSEIDCLQQTIQDLENALNQEFGNKKHLESQIRAKTENI